MYGNKCRASNHNSEVSLQEKQASLPTSSPQNLMP